jgi:hypothetical protein
MAPAIRAARLIRLRRWARAGGSRQFYFELSFQLLVGRRFAVLQAFPISGELRCRLQNLWRAEITFFALHQFLQPSQTELFGLTHKSGAAVSIPANIAEGAVAAGPRTPEDCLLGRRARHDSLADLPVWSTQAASNGGRSQEGDCRSVEIGEAEQRLKTETETDRRLKTDD